MGKIFAKGKHRSSNQHFGDQNFLTSITSRPAPRMSGNYSGKKWSTYKTNSAEYIGR